MDWQRDTAWHRLDERGNEHAAFMCGDEVCVIEGVGVLAFNGSGMVFEYHLEFDPGWVFTGGVVMAKVGEDQHSRTLERKANGDWYVDGVHAERFTGLKDVDLSFSPSTNTATIKRLALDTGAEMRADAVFLSEPTLKVSGLEQRYKRVGDGTYVYSAGGQETAISVDEEGLVLDYPGHFQAMAAARQPG